MARGSPRTVLVTGASTGIGRATALRLARSGFQVFAGVRRPADGKVLTAEQPAIEPVICDVTDPTQIEAAAELIRERAEDGLGGLVNNAGVAKAGPLEYISIDDLRRQLEVNLIGQVAVAQRMTAPLRSGRGVIVNVTSIGGRVVTPLFGPYHASKFALEAITDALRQELAPWGIDVAAVEPGSVKTEIWDRGIAEARRMRGEMDPGAEEMYGERMDSVLETAVSTGARGIGPDRVAKVIESALTARTPRPRYLVGADAYGMLALAKLLPARTWDRLLGRFAG